MTMQLHHLSTAPSSLLQHHSQRTRSSAAPVNALHLTAALGGGIAEAKRLIQSGTVKTILPKDAAAAMAKTTAESFSLLDIRPQWERQKAHVPGSLHVPLFVEDTDNTLITLLKKWVHLGYIGLWTGQKFTTLNSHFLLQVESIAPDKNSMLLVACGEGLRSMIAVSKLHQAGYKNLGWLAGGFSRSKDGDFPVNGAEKLQHATVGGASYYFLKLLLLLQPNS